MSLSRFIPTIWSARLFTALRNSLVYAQEGVINRNYEGEIRAAGNTVKIHGIGEVTIGDYTRNTPMADPEFLSDTEATLVIDQAKSFNFAIDDVDAAQMSVSVMDEAMKSASYGLKKVADTFVAARHVDAISGNRIGSDGTPTVLYDDELGASALYKYLVDLGVMLDEQNCPEDGRYVVMPAWAVGVMRKDTRFVLNAGSGEATNALRNGRVGTVANFQILTSNLVPNVSGLKYKIMAGHPSAITFADQIVKVEAYRPESLFADAVKGLHVFGAKTIRPEWLAVLNANKPIARP